MRIFDKVISVVVTISTILALLAAAIIFLPKPFGIVPYIVKSGSMEPVIPTGAVAYFNTHDTSVEAGDIILFHLNAEMKVTHRIVREEGGKLVTKGDANSIEDAALLDPADVEGTFLFCIPEIGFFYAQMTRIRCVAAALIIALLHAGATLLHTAVTY